MFSFFVVFTLIVHIYARVPRKPKTMAGQHSLGGVLINNSINQSYIAA